MERRGNMEGEREGRALTRGDDNTEWNNGDRRWRWRSVGVLVFRAAGWINRGNPSWMHLESIALSPRASAATR